MADKQKNTKNNSNVKKCQMHTPSEPQAVADSRIHRRIFVSRKSAERNIGFFSFLLRENHIRDNFKFILATTRRRNYKVVLLFVSR